MICAARVIRTLVQDTGPSPAREVVLSAGLGSLVVGIAAAATSPTDSLVAAALDTLAVIIGKGRDGSIRAAR